MGRAFLSSKYEVARPVTPIITPIPKYNDAPFDLDSDFDSDDVVYEAFCTPEEYKERVANLESVRTTDEVLLPSTLTSGPSAPEPPLPSGHDQEARVLPYFPTFIQRLADGREIQTESPLPNLPRLVSELRPVLSRPEVRAVLPDADLINPMHSSETQEEIHQRVIRIRRALRPYIVDFLQRLPMTSGAGYITSLVERALVLDALGARGLDYFEAITRLGEQEGLDQVGSNTAVADLDASNTSSGNTPIPIVDEPSSASLSTRSNGDTLPYSPAPNITINPSEWWLTRPDSPLQPRLPIRIRAEFAPPLDAREASPGIIPSLPLNYLTQDQDMLDASDSSGSSRPDSPSDDPLLPPLPRPNSENFVPRSSLPSSGQMFAAFTDMATGEGIPRAFSNDDWYYHPIFSGPLR